MEPKEAAVAAAEHLIAYQPGVADAVADGLQDVWVRAAPPEEAQSLRDWGIDAPNYPAVGTPVPVLRAIGKEVGKRARKRVDDYLPLTCLLWDQYGREGRLVASVALGPMELAEPEKVVPVIYDLAQRCVFWEDCDQLAMKALEPILRKDPEGWLERLGTWVKDENKWVCRAALTAIGRLPMERPAYTARCVELVAPALGNPDRDVKRALSFALRVCARGEIEPVKEFIRQQRGVTDADSLWVLCDAIRSMTKKYLPDLVDLLPLYRDWLETAEPKARRGVEGAVRLLERAAGA